ncbi:MAG: ASKHA domain-containing protein, partial [Phycisphaerae bacterium]|nr:ASKHA domain-containing protein [Phycisphaerae bacterium]
MSAKEKKLCNIRFEPSGLKVEVPRGTNLLEAARLAGVYLTSICGGDGYCGKCKVIVDAGEVRSRPTTLLTQREVRENFCLACQSQVFGDLAVTVPKSHGLETTQILMDSDAHRFSQLDGEAPEAEAFPFDPLVRKFLLKMSPPTVQDNTADHERLYVAIGEQIDAPVMQTGFRILQQLPGILQKADYKVTATVARRGGNVREVVQVEPGDCTGRNFAVVVDVGTTTVVAHLVNLSSATTVDSEATYNSQMHFGEDYIRRIMYAEQNDAFGELQDRIVGDVNSLITTLAVRQNVDLQEITAVMCSGNTAMVHFLLNLDSRRIRREPYVAAAALVPPIRAAEAGIRINKRGLLYCLPSVAAYVGSDIVAGVLATRLYNAQKVCLFVDIGTNGEVVLGNREWMVCASSSAGPAFEGSGVRHG